MPGHQRGSGREPDNDLSSLPMLPPMLPFVRSGRKRSYEPGSAQFSKSEGRTPLFERSPDICRPRTVNLAMVVFGSIRILAPKLPGLFRDLSISDQKAMLLCY